MANLKVQLSKDSTISLSTTDDCSHLKSSIKITITKDEIQHAGEKSILRKTQVNFTVDEYNMLKLSLPALDGLVNYYACAKQFNIL